VPATRLARSAPGWRRCIVQPPQLGLGHLVIAIREDQIDVPIGQARRYIAGDVAILDVDTDRLHPYKRTLPDASRKYRGTGAAFGGILAATAASG
jgi:hypothetical protein